MELRTLLNFEILPGRSLFLLASTTPITAFWRLADIKRLQSALLWLNHLLKVFDNISDLLCFIICLCNCQLCLDICLDFEILNHPGFFIFICLDTELFNFLGLLLLYFRFLSLFLGQIFHLIFLKLHQVLKLLLRCQV